MTLNELMNRFTLKHMPLNTDTSGYWDDLEAVVAKAKEEERERCAKLAANAGRHLLAKAIRAGEGGEG